MSGVILALLTGGGIGFKLLLAQDWSGLAGWAVGTMFIPSAALAMGVWSRSSKLFEALFILCWYIGPIHKAGQFNFMTTSPDAIAAELPKLYLGATIALLVAALIGRRTSRWRLGSTHRIGHPAHAGGSGSYRASSRLLIESITLKNPITIGLPAKIQVAAARAM